MFDVRTLFAALRPAAPATAYERGVAALERGRYGQALEELAAAVRLAESSREAAAAHNKRGVALIALGERDAALDAFCAASAADDRCAPALANVGNLLLEDGHVLDAVDYYEAAIRIDDRLAAAHRNLGVALRRLGRRPEAIRALKTATRLEGPRSAS